MDEFGSRIQHSDEPTFATAPLFYMPQQIAYTVLWPLRDLETGGKSVRVRRALLGTGKKISLIPSVTDAVPHPIGFSLFVALQWSRDGQKCPGSDSGSQKRKIFRKKSVVFFSLRSKSAHNCQLRLSQFVGGRGRR